MTIHAEISLAFSAIVNDVQISILEKIWDTIKILQEDI